jgi:uncharacterized protein YjdB
VIFGLTYTWSTGAATDTGTATITSGVATGVDAGSVTIIATEVVSGKTATAALTVTCSSTQFVLTSGS